MGTYEAPEAGDPPDERRQGKRRAVTSASAPIYVSGNMTLDQAAHGWTRRGYVIQYADPYLVQVVRRERLRTRDIGVFGVVGVVIGACVVVVIAVLRGRLWRVVTLVARPDGRILMHQQSTHHPPRG
ncbi:MAG TPA: hypothetical protein VGR88_02945 [Ktedonobacterales bacterium]|nr:hypothetical protein [Ktedonobacterales bacterium]